MDQSVGLLDAARTVVTSSVAGTAVEEEPANCRGGDDESSSVEYLLEKRRRCIEDDSSAKDTEKGDGSDSGVEFGGSGGGVNLKRLSTGEAAPPASSSPITTTATIDIGDLPQQQQTSDNDDHGTGASNLTCRANGALQREVYATEGQYSCDSSMLSFCSEENLLGDGKTPLNSGLVRDCASEGGGSESSSVYNQPVMATNAKKRVNGVSGGGEGLGGGGAGGNMDKMTGKTISSSSMMNLKMETTTMTLGRAKMRASSVHRVGPPALMTRERARSKEHGQGAPLVRANSMRRPPKPDSLPVSSPMMTTTATPKRMSTLSRTQSVRTPGTTPAGGGDSGRWPYGPSMTASSSIGTPRSAAALRSAYNESVMVKTRLGHMSLDHGSAQSTFDKYATLPRRRRERSADQRAVGSGAGAAAVAPNPDSSTRSSSISRDRVTKMSTSTMNLKTPMSSNITTAGQTPKMRSVVRRLTQKVKIYHETASQTAMTSQDVENAFAGKAAAIDIMQCDKTTVGTQSEVRDRELEALRNRVKHLTEESEQLRSSLTEKSIMLTGVEQQLGREKEGRLKLQKELQCNSERVIAILESHAGIQSGDVMIESTDSLMMLESKVTSDSQMVANLKGDLKKMRNVCTALRQELEEALERERGLIAERETEEMQEFLAIEEETVLTDAVKMETDKERAKWQEVIQKKDQEIKWLLEECRHLVRFCEQRRQENMGMQAKYGALEMKSKELLAQQGSAVSGASVALNSLGGRLEQLVEQLIASYNISEQELEDVVFHNEAFPESGSSNGEDGDCMNSPSDDATTVGGVRNGHDKDLSPQRSHSFINVVINAIRNATSLRKEQQENQSQQTPTRKDVPLPKRVERIQEEGVGMFANRMQDSEGSTDMLDSETEPCLMMENVLVDSRQDPISSEIGNGTTAAGDRSLDGADDDDVLLEDDEDHSLNNLSQAISNRQQIELQTSQMLSISNKKALLLLKQSSMEDDVSHASSLAEDMPAALCGYCTNTQTIIEQVISVDNLITKLLKVLRIVQLDNDDCIQRLIGEKNKLQENKDDTEDRIKDCEDVNENLKSQLTAITQQLLNTEGELNLSKSELQNCRQEIEKLNHHICELSTLCSNKENNNTDNIQTEGIEQILKALMMKLGNTDNWKGEPAGEGELYHNIMSLLKSNRELRSELTGNPNMNWQVNAISDLKRLYEAIDSALEVLNATQEVVQQYPALMQLQKDLEETNFTLATTLPSYMAMVASLQQPPPQRDLNANPTVTLLAEEATNGNGSPAIDSMA